MLFIISNRNNETGSSRCRAFFKNYACMFCFICCLFIYFNYFIFGFIADTNPDVIGPEGIEKLCMDLQVKPEDIVILVLSWKLNAKVMGIYTLNEWLNGMSDLNCLFCYLFNQLHLAYVETKNCLT